MVKHCGQRVKGTVPVIVHSWFRSGSTWLWNKLRTDSRFRAYYEPFNEELPLWTPEKIRTSRAGAFEGDNHPDTEKSYFFEYLDLIASDRLGFEDGFSYERYFLEPAEDDARLKAYLQRLISDAEHAGLRPALCFCRSQMRALWMKENIGGVHIAQIRNPWQQWVSFGKHPYFKNRALLTAYCLDRRHPGLFSHVGEFDGIKTAWQNRQSARISDIGCFSVYVTIWIASAAQAIAASDLVIDIDRIGSDPDKRRIIERQLECNGFPADLSDCRAPTEQSRISISETHRREMERAAIKIRAMEDTALLSFPRGAAIRKLEDLSVESAAFLEMALA
jgi:hypothetical protein